MFAVRGESLNPKSVNGGEGVWLVMAKQAENTERMKRQKTPGKSLCYG